MRHLERNHKSEDEVNNIFQLPKNSKERRRAFAPNRQIIKKPNEQEVTYYPCAYCKGLFLKEYLKRHAKSCFVQKQAADRQEGKHIYHISNSQTIIACAMDPTDVISKLNVKEQVFKLMKADEIGFEAKKDLLIAHFGEPYLKRHRKERMAYACSNRMRELSRLLISYRKIMNNKNIAFKDMLFPKHFDTVITAVREISGYDHVKKSYRAPSLAMHLGTSLKMACDELTHLILKESKGYKCGSLSEAQTWFQNIKSFKKLVESRWNTELASLANKDMMEKRWNKPLLLPLVSGIKKFRDGVLKIAEECKEKLLYDDKNENQRSYKLLVHCTLALLIVFNRRRIGDVQYLKIKDYQNDQKSNAKDFENALTNTEKILTTKYKRVVNSGKGSRAVVILVPKALQNFIDLLLEHREKYISGDNEYVFATPGSTIKWGKGDVAIRTLSKKIQLENPEAISSNKLRKHIATVMQILNLTKDEAKQFANFMGHTQKTHDEFYELPVDIYQTAKVSKLLLMMEKGSVPIEYKGKSLAEINLDPNLEYVEEDNNEGVILLNSVDATENDNENDKGTNTKNLPDNDNDIQGWSNEEITLIKERFKSSIRKKNYPSGEEIKEFIKKSKIKRTVPVIKSKIQHLIKLSLQ
ncbi:hypothetical protein RI129_003114 [Pyrocoelia pectoralis]|uniref:Uncharacterized protein n=1 Tax=Pyrocoelia pectoralis TaxID=417401 RepID=A0AAN7VHK5_9COLE